MHKHSFNNPGEGTVSTFVVSSVEDNSFARTVATAVKYCFSELSTCNQPLLIVLNFL